LVVVVDGTDDIETSWSLLFPNGEKLFGDGAGVWDSSCLLSSSPSASPAPTVDCEDYTLTLFDSYGDGWGGATMTLMTCDYDTVLAEGLTLPTGTTVTFTECLATSLQGELVVQVSGGVSASEMSWVMDLPSGVKLGGSGTGRWDSSCGAPCQHFVVDLMDDGGDG
jgi:hypothetical protein